MRRGGRAALPAGIRRALVLGASRSGIAAALALSDLDVEVTLSDRRGQEALYGIDAALRAGVRFVKEESLAERWPCPDLLVKSPGVPGEAEAVVRARKNGVPVWSELELAYAVLPNPFDAITGTNGKTTTTALLGHLFKTAGRRVRVLGNIGVAVTSVAGEIAADEEVVVEVSSFQLEDTHQFRPAVGVFLNLTPDHLDRHGTMERYLACKANLFAKQRAGDVAVLNLADAAVAGLGAQLAARQDGPRVAYFSTQRGAGPAPAARATRDSASATPDSWIEGGLVVIDGEPALPVGDIRLPGLHNLENCLAAATAARARGVGREALAEGLRTFQGVTHRLEQAGMVAGVTYVNDSKATNVEATLTALNAYPERTHLILGGRDKASDYRPVARACARGCKARLSHRRGDSAHRGCFCRGGRRWRGGPDARSGLLGRSGESGGGGVPGRGARRRRVAGAGVRQLRPVQELRRARRPLQDPRAAPPKGEAVTATTVRKPAHRAQPTGEAPRPAKPEVNRRQRAARSKEGQPLPYHLTWVLTGILLVIGLCMMLSVSTAVTSGDKFGYLRNQGITAAVGVCAILLLSRIDYRRFRSWSVAFLAFIVLSLLLLHVPGVARSEGGSASYIPLGPFTYQPSEFAKLAVVLLGAHLLTSRRVADGRFWSYMWPFGVAGLAMCLLVFWEGDLGTAIIIAGLMMGMLWIGGMKGRHWALIAAIGCAGVLG